MAKKLRTDADLSIHDGAHRSFEWYWAPNGTMPGLDAYESMTRQTQDDFIASVRHWGNVEPGKHPARSRINQENEDPLIVAIKAGKQRLRRSKRREERRGWSATTISKKAKSATRPVIAPSSKR